MNASEEPWTPLSQRERPTDGFDGPFEGVPAWLADSLVAWAGSTFSRSATQSWSEVMDALTTFERRSRFRLEGATNPSDKAASLLRLMYEKSDVLLDAVDFTLNRLDSRYPPDVGRAKALNLYLLEGGSVWHVARRGDSFRLERRVSEGATAAMTEVEASKTRASRHLAEAWTRAYGRKPDPSGAYREAVKAVEAGAKGTVLPDDSSATLGKMIRALEDGSAKFEVSLEPKGLDAILGVVAMMRMLWTAQLDRHGTDDDSVPLEVSQDAAEAALHLSVTLVQWFESGVVRRRG